MFQKKIFILSLITLLCLSACDEGMGINVTLKSKDKDTDSSQAVSIDIDGCTFESCNFGCELFE